MDLNLQLKSSSQEKACKSLKSLVHGSPSVCGQIIYIQWLPEPNQYQPFQLGGNGLEGTVEFPVHICVLNKPINV